MLNLVWLSQQACQKELWSEFDPTRQTWIVSDRKTKFFLNQSLLKKHSIISDPVKRAKEFWKDLLRLADPEMRVLEDLGSRVQARDFLLSTGQSEWCRRPHAPQKLLDACQNISSLITHPDALDILRQFEDEFHQSAASFLEIARLGIDFYKKSLERKRLPNSFLAYYLSQWDGPLAEGRELIFDLNFDMTVGEKDLIQALAKTNNVTVLIPASDKTKLGEAGYAYSHIGLGVPQVDERQVLACQPEAAKLELWRCSSPEAEARKAVELVARWVENGIAPNKIAICADNFSNYENILAHDLEWEGIGLHRRLQTVLSASRLFRALNARLLVIKGTLKASVLEEAFLSVAEYKKTQRRRQERAVLKPILREDQVPHEELRQKIKALQGKKKQRLTVVEFESLVIEMFKDLALEASKYEEDVIESEERNELFLRALQKLRSEVGDADLEFNQWIEAWQDVTNSIKLPIKQPVENGVWGVELSSVEEASAEYLIILGSLESSGRSSVVAGLGDAKLSFLNTLGFDLSSPTKRKTDPLMNWLLSGARRHIILSCPKTDSSGKAVAANPLWLKLAAHNKKNLEQLDYAQHTRWVDVQKSILKKETASQVDAFKEWVPGTTEKMGVLVMEELMGQRKIQLPEQSARPLPILLSASRIESYWECPYKFFARAYLGLFDEEDLEVEPSAQKRGQWLHAAVEKIMGSKRDLKLWTDAELEVLINSLDQVQKQVSSDVWPSIRSRFVRQLRRFIEFESDWQKDFPKAKPAGLEAPLRGILEWPKDKPQIKFALRAPSSTDDYWADFKGSIDRVDVTPKGDAIIIDYKNSATSASNIPSWPANGTFQLALYSEAVEAGLWEGKPKKIIAAQYYTLRRPNRDKGFKVIDEDLIGVLPSDGAKSAVSREKRQEYFGAIDGQVHDILEKIRLGHMTPEPHSDKLCPACSWRTSCRAPHLS